MDSSDLGILSLSVKLIQNAVGSALFGSKDSNSNADGPNNDNKLQDPVLVKGTELLLKAAELNHTDSIYVLGAMNLVSYI